jgi:hypothetical protein
MEQFVAKRITNNDTGIMSLSERIKDLFTIKFVLKSYLYTFIISILITAFLSFVKPQVLTLTKHESILASFYISLSYSFIYCSIILFLTWFIKPNKMIGLISLNLIGICLGIIVGHEAKILILQYVFSYTTASYMEYLLFDIATGFAFGGGAVISFMRR